MGSAYLTCLLVVVVSCSYSMLEIIVRLANLCMPLGYDEFSLQLAGAITNFSLCASIRTSNFASRLRRPSISVSSHKVIFRPLAKVRSSIPATQRVADGSYIPAALPISHLHRSNNVEISSCCRLCRCCPDICCNVGVTSRRRGHLYI